MVVERAEIGSLAIKKVQLEDRVNLLGKLIEWQGE